MYQNRLTYYKSLGEQFQSNVILYVTGDRRNLESQIASDVIDLFIGHLDKMGVQNRISLFLYTRGGDTAAAWNIINLLRMYCEELQVIVPHKAHSAGTIISLGANEIIMTKQATLSPIDPSLNTPLNPVVPNAPIGTTMPVSVEAVKGYLAFAKEELGITDATALSNIMIKLTEYVHPLVLGQVFRSKAQIKMLAEKLLKHQNITGEKLSKIVDFLCSDSGSHDYTINRREALDFGLKIRKPDELQYKLIKALYNDIADELCLNTPFDLTKINGEYAERRCLVESSTGGSDYFITEGTCSHVRTSNNQVSITNQVRFEGWRHETCFEQEISHEGEEAQYNVTPEFSL